jgi:hypothetical protein
MKFNRAFIAPFSSVFEAPPLSPLNSVISWRENDGCLLKTHLCASIPEPAQIVPYHQSPAVPTEQCSTRPHSSAAAGESGATRR